MFIAEGEKVVRRAIEGGYEPRSLLMAERWLEGLADVLDQTDAPCYVMTEQLAEAVSGFHVHRGALASLRRLPLPSTAELLDALPASSDTSRVRVAVLEALVDHGNVGSVFRNAAALGCRPCSPHRNARIRSTGGPSRPAWAMCFGSLGREPPR